MRFAPRRLVGLTLVAALCLTLTSCSTKDVVEVGLLGLQTVAEQAAASGQIPQTEANRIVTYATQALVVCQTTPSGWQVTVQAGWASFVKDLPAAEQVQFANAIAIITGAINGL